MVALGSDCRSIIFLQHLLLPFCLTLARVPALCTRCINVAHQLHACMPSKLSKPWRLALPSSDICYSRFAKANTSPEKLIWTTYPLLKCKPKSDSQKSEQPNFASTCNLLVLNAEVVLTAVCHWRPGNWDHRAAGAALPSRSRHAFGQRLTQKMLTTLLVHVNFTDSNC